MTSIASTGRRLVRELLRFTRDRGATSAVEFAFLLPLMLLLYIGSAEVSRAVSASRKVTLVARTIADLVARVQTIDTPGMADVFSAGTAVMAPFTNTTVMTVSQIKIDAQKNATIDWSKSYGGGTPHAAGSPVTLQNALIVANTYLIWGEVQYNYTPILASTGTGVHWGNIAFQLAPRAFNDQIYMAPRLGNSVACTAAGC